MRRDRLPLLGLLVALTLGAAVLGEAHVEAPPPAPVPSAAAPVPPPAAEDDVVEAIRRQRAELAPGADDLFRAHSWKPKPPPEKPAPPPRPVAPPLPFAYLGRLQEGGETSVFLRRGDVPIVARAQQVIDGVYRVEEITERRVSLTFLPLGQRQDLVIGPPQ